ncbi:hypothetical protein ACS0TY_013171 [Phlomoides rotata]
MKILSFNIRGLGSKIKTKEISDLIRPIELSYVAFRNLNWKLLMKGFVGQFGVGVGWNGLLERQLEDREV